ncbi:MAG: VCBS repeat-containing protein [Planctomycetota bacterium]|nr:MAG: VCBS repeat-containing protein [Planctomycetota bacterium]
MKLDFRFILVPFLLISLTAGASGQTQTPEIQQQWAFGSYGQGIGLSNLEVAFRNGSPEIYCGGSLGTFGANDFWQVLTWDSSRNEFRQRYFSPLYEGGIDRLLTGDLDGDGRKEVVVLEGTGRVLLYSQENWQELGEFQSAASSSLPLGMALADLQGDGSEEVVLCDQQNLYVYSGDGQLRWQFAGAGGRDVVVAQMDLDPSLEIATTSGAVVDATSQSLQWQYPNGFGVEVEAADLDGDGMAEIVAMEEWDRVYAFDVDQQWGKWSIPNFDNGAIALADVDGDGQVEVLLGDGQWGDIQGFDGNDLSLEWSISNPDHGTTDIAVADLDGDGKNEVLWGAGATSTGADHLHVGDWASQVLTWSSVHLDGPFLGPLPGDLDGDGTEEWVAVSRESDAGYGSGRILVFDGQDLSLRGMSDQVGGGFSFEGIQALTLRDVDQDGDFEILVGCDRLYDGLIEIYDFDAQNQFHLQWSQNGNPSGSSFTSLDAVDVDGDGAMEILGGVRRTTTGAPGVFLYVYDYATGNEEWHSLQMGDYWGSISDLTTGDLDGDGSLEMAAIVEGGDLYIYDGITRQLEAMESGGYTTVEFRNRHTRPQLLLGHRDGSLSLRAFENGAFPEIGRRSVSQEAIDGVRQIPKDRYWIGSGGRLQIHQVGIPGPLWQSEDFGRGFGRSTHFMKSASMFLSAGEYGILGFQVR